MSSSQNTFQTFRAEEYNNTFYYCEDAHPFIAFVTCYCPLCESRKESQVLQNELDEAEYSADQYAEMYEQLVVKVADAAPELLI